MGIPILKQPDLTNVAAGNVATTIINPIGTHYGFFLEFLDNSNAPVSIANIKAEVEHVTVRINGQEVLSELTPQFLLARQAYYKNALGGGEQAGILAHSWVDSSLDTAGERTLLAIGTGARGQGAAQGGVDDFTVEVKLASALTHISKIQCFAAVTEEQRLIGQHIRIRKFPRSFASTGEVELTDLPKDLNTGYKAIHFEEGAGAIDYVTARVGNTIMHEKVSSALNKQLLRDAKREPQAGYYHLAFDLVNRIGDVLPMKGIKDFRQIIAFGTVPNSYNIYVEQIFNLK